MLGLTDISFNKVRGRRVLIVGEVGSGKTRLTRRLLTEALAGGRGNVSVIDMAPKPLNVNGLLAGGALLQEPDPRVRYLAPKEVKAPRLSARDAGELIEFADQNRKEIEGLLEDFLREPTEDLFVNDVSIYLQRGDLERLWKAFSAAYTVVANGYLGERLAHDFGSGLSEREANLMRRLAGRMDEVIRL